MGMTLVQVSFYLRLMEAFIMLFENTKTIQTRSLPSKLVLSRTLASMLVTLSLAATPLTSWSQDEGTAVKMSESGICHDASSRHYERVKNFKPYQSMQECLDAGGRKPKK